MRRLKPATAAREWLISNALFELLARRHESTLRVRYEDFVSDAERTIDRIASLAGAAADRLAETPWHHSVSGNPSRFAGATPVLRLDDEWREKLSARDRIEVTAITAPLLLVYGYIARSPGASAVPSGASTRGSSTAAD
jgi:hypothetical protein